MTMRCDHDHNHRVLTAHARYAQAIRDVDRLKAMLTVAESALQSAEAELRALARRES